MTRRPNSAYRSKPDCLIVGGGQGGLALAARLKQFGVPTLIVDALPRPGDGWRRRYRSLCLHDPVWYDHMPYLPFPDHWPIYTPKDKMGDWLEAYASIMELDIWNATTCKRAELDNASKRWAVEVEREGQHNVKSCTTGSGDRHVNKVYASFRPSQIGASAAKLLANSNAAHGTGSSSWLG